jgi:hypothetical protein
MHRPEACTPGVVLTRWARTAILSSSIMNEGLFPAKLGLLFFWMLWLWIAFLTNLCGGLKALGVLPRSWRFASDNFRAVAEAASRYRAPPWLAVSCSPRSPRGSFSRPGSSDRRFYLR